MRLQFSSLARIGDKIIQSWLFKLVLQSARGVQILSRFMGRKAGWQMAINS